MNDNPLYLRLRAEMETAAAGALLADLERFLDSFGDHDPDCPGFDARGREAELAACTCGFARRYDFLDELKKRLDQG